MRSRPRSLRFGVGLQIATLALLHARDHHHHHTSNWTYGYCAFTARGEPLSPRLAQVTANVQLSEGSCVQIARGEGWAPLINPQMEPKSWKTISAAGPYCEGEGFPVFPSSLAHGEGCASRPDPLQPVARLFRAVGALSDDPVLCFVGDSTTQELVSDMSMAHARLDSLPAAALASYGLRKPLPVLALIRTTFSADCIRKATGFMATARTACDARCVARCEAAEGTTWRKVFEQQHCSAVVFEPSTAHFVATERSEGHLQALRGLIARLKVNASSPYGEHDARLMLSDEVSSQVAELWTRFAGGVPSSLARSLASSLEYLSGWATKGRRIVIMRSPSPQHHWLTGDFTDLHWRFKTKPRLAVRLADASSDDVLPDACTCPPMRPDVAESTRLAAVARFIRDAVADLGSTRIGFADTHAALARLPGAHQLHLGCSSRRVTAWACSAGVRGGVGGRVREQVYPSPKAAEAALFGRQVDVTCDCTHYGFSPSKLAAIAMVLASEADRIAVDRR